MTKGWVLSQSGSDIQIPGIKQARCWRGPQAPITQRRSTITGTRQSAFQRESKQTVTRNDGDVLHAIHHIGHRCHDDLPTQILVIEQFSTFCVEHVEVPSRPPVISRSVTVVNMPLSLTSYCSNSQTSSPVFGSIALSEACPTSSVQLFTGLVRPMPIVGASGAGASTLNPPPRKALPGVYSCSSER